MHRPPHFDLDDDAALAEAAARGFGTLVVAGGDGLEASPLPFLLDRTDGAVRLSAHVARGNPLVARLQAPAPALMVVDVVDGYVSPTWYASKAEHHRVVPTWNYVAVHLHGDVRLVGDEDWLRGFVGRLTDRHEAPMATPWSVDDAPAEFVDALLHGIVGIEMDVTRVEGKAKLSQNRSAADTLGVQHGVRSMGQAALADRMAAAPRKEP